MTHYAATSIGISAGPTPLFTLLKSRLKLLLFVDTPCATTTFSSTLVSPTAHRIHQALIPYKLPSAALTVSALVDLPSGCQNTVWPYQSLSRPGSCGDAGERPAALHRGHAAQPKASRVPKKCLMRGGLLSSTGVKSGATLDLLPYNKEELLLFVKVRSAFLCMHHRCHLSIPGCSSIPILSITSRLASCE